jgi:16S rRNA (cytosine1402-N4)-methyltransferase
MHETVLLREAVDALAIRPDGFYVDGTYGRGGHSAEILSRLGENGRLLAFDKDPQAIASARSRFAGDVRFDIVHDSFAVLSDVLDQRASAGGVDGILLDLGVSSPQLDEAERGFSFMREGPLDMRMNTSAGISAAQWLARAEAGEITRVLRDYGEEKFAPRMARAIVEARTQQPITTTRQLADIVAAANPRWEKHKHPATRAFQAIRIFINDELGDLERLLDQVLQQLVVGGRLVVISFHSLEDRIVKQFIRHHERGGDIPKGVPLMDSQINRRMREVMKPVRVDEDERDANVRARSAIMRVAEKLA